MKPGSYKQRMKLMLGLIIYLLSSLYYVPKIFLAEVLRAYKNFVIIDEIKLYFSPMTKIYKQLFSTKNN